VKKAAGAEHQRIMGELVAQHTHQMNQTNARLAEMHNNEMAMRSRLDEVQMEKIHTVTQFQAQVDNLAHQLQMAQNVPTPTFNDPSLLTELEQLRSLRDRYEGQLNEFLLENKNLKEQLTTLQETLVKKEQKKVDLVMKVVPEAAKILPDFSADAEMLSHVRLPGANVPQEDDYSKQHGLKDVYVYPRSRPHLAR